MSIVLDNDGILFINGMRFEIPELVAMKGFEQKNPWHPENDLLNHTQQVLGIAKQIDASHNVQLAAVFHDIGKPKTAQPHKVRTEHLTFYGHDTVGYHMFKKLVKLYDFEQFGFDLERVAQLILNHIKINRLDDMGKEKREAFLQMECFEELKILLHCDKNGRAV